MIFLKYSRLVLINFLMTNLCFAIDVVPEGKLITNMPSISENPTVKMYLGSKKVPLIKLTPGRPTVVQFPEEIRNCTSANAIIKFDYADKAGSETSNSNPETEWFSSIVLNVNPEFIKNISVENLLKMPVTNVTCKIRVSSPDSKLSESYTWKSIGIKIVNPDETYFIVYLLNGIENKSDSLFTEKDLEQLPFVDITKFYKDDINSKKLTNNKNDATEIEKSQKKSISEFEGDKKVTNKNNDINILDLYDFNEKIDKSSIKQF